MKPNSAEGDSFKISRCWLRYPPNQESFNSVSDLVHAKSPQNALGTLDDNVLVWRQWVQPEHGRSGAWPLDPSLLWSRFWCQGCNLGETLPRDVTLWCHAAECRAMQPLGVRFLQNEGCNVGYQVPLEVQKHNACWQAALFI